MALGAGRGAKPAGQCEFTRGHEEMDGEAISTALQLVITAEQLSRIQKYHCGVHVSFFRNWP